ncbi:hypothetical protein MHBO_000491, partial [Bonamia ostreae]
MLVLNKFKKQVKINARAFSKKRSVINEAELNKARKDWNQKYDWESQYKDNSDQIIKSFQAESDENFYNLFQPMDHFEKKSLPFSETANLIKVKNLLVSENQSCDDEMIKSFFEENGVKTKKIVYLTDELGSPNGEAIVQTNQKMEKLGEMNESKITNLRIVEKILEKIRKLSQTNGSLTIDLRNGEITTKNDENAKLLNLKNFDDFKKSEKNFVELPNFNSEVAFLRIKTSQLDELTKLLQKRIKERSTNVFKVDREKQIAQTKKLDRIELQFKERRNGAATTRTETLNKIAKSAKGIEFLNFLLIQLVKHDGRSIGEEKELFYESLHDALFSEKFSCAHSPEVVKAIENFANTPLGNHSLELLKFN